MKVALWSAAPALGNIDENTRTVLAAMDTTAELVVFPELFLSGYNIGDDVQRIALQADDARVQALAKECKARGKHLIVGAPHKTRDGLVYNAALCIDDAGAVTWIAKRALPNFTTFREGMFFAHGPAQPVWTTRFGAIGVHICYDLYFPELQKRQVLDGADILVNISASPATSRKFFEALLPARAIENACFVLYANNVGSQDGIVFWGGSRAYGPRAELIACMEEYESGVVDAELDLAALQPAREFRPTLRDTDPEDMAVVEQP